MSDLLRGNYNGTLAGLDTPPQQLGNLFNPYLQDNTPNFGANFKLPAQLNNKFQTEKGNPWDAFNSNLQYPPKTRLPETMTKMGTSLNADPEILPKNLVNIKRPEYALIENQRVGVQLGMEDQYRDNPYSEFNRGISYYTLFVGDNPKQRITPVIYPQAWRPEEWAQRSVDFPQVNRKRTEDITDLTMDTTYSCGSCTIPSASLGTPAVYEPRNPRAPLPLSNPGEFPFIGQYTAREIGRDTRDFPPRTNPIVDLQLRKLGIPTMPIEAEYDDQMLSWLRHGYKFF